MTALKMGKPTIVLVHGAWHRPEHFELLDRALKSHGYETRRPSLPSCVEKGSSPPNDIRADIVAVREVIEEVLNGGSNVLVVPHSYGGVPTMSAVKGMDAATRKAAGHDSHVIGIAAIASFLPAEGETLCTAVDLPDGDPGVYPTENGACWLPEDSSHKSMYARLSEDEAAPWQSLLRSISNKHLYHSTSEYTAYKDIPVHFLFCSEDQAMLVPWQRTTIQKLQDRGADIRVEEIDWDHSPYIGHAERTSDFLRRSAGEDIPL